MKIKFSLIVFVLFFSTACTPPPVKLLNGYEIKPLAFLPKAKLEGVILRDADLHGAVLSEANLKNSMLADSDL